MNFKLVCFLSVIMLSISISHAESWEKKSDSYGFTWETRDGWEKFPTNTGGWYAYNEEIPNEVILAVRFIPSRQPDQNDQYIAYILQIKYNLAFRAIGTKLSDLRETINYKEYRPDLAKVKDDYNSCYKMMIENNNKYGSRFYYLKYKEIDALQKIRIGQESGGAIGWIENRIFSYIQSNIMSFSKL